MRNKIQLIAAIRNFVASELGYLPGLAATKTFVESFLNQETEKKEVSTLQLVRKEN